MRPGLITLLVAIYAVLIAILLGGGAVSIWSQRESIEALRHALDDNASGVIIAEKLRAMRERKGRRVRSYLVSNDPKFLELATEAHREFSTSLVEAWAGVIHPDERKLIDRVAQAEQEHDAILMRFVERNRAGEPLERIGPELERAISPYRNQLDWALDALVMSEQRLLEEAERDARRKSDRTVQITEFLVLFCALAVGGLSIGLVRALTQLRRSRRDLEHHASRLEQSNRDLDAFAGRLAHDFRNILAPLPLIAAGLVRSTDAPDRVASIAERIANLNQRACGLLDGLLAFSRAAHPNEPQACAPLSAAIQAALEEQAARIAVVGVRVELQIEDATVACSPALLNAVVANLVGNAVKFLEGRERREVRISCRVRDRTCILEVADTGPGIAPDHRARIFEPFYRAPGTTVPGTGIGLATVQRIVNAHGGAVSVTSTVGAGATFTVVLPLASEELRSLQRGAGAPESPRA